MNWSSSSTNVAGFCCLGAGGADHSEQRHLAIFLLFMLTPKFNALRNAIGVLPHSDPSIQSEAIDICENFQTPAAFGFKTCGALIGADQPVQFRIFGYNSLRFIISCHWDAIASETQQQITSLFPCCDLEEAIESSLFHTIVRCTSSLLTIVVPLDLIESLFGDLPMLMFTSALFSEFIVSIYSEGMTPVHRCDVRHFLRQRGVGFATVLAIGPLFE
jgi:hypothetical protein